jgi:hypothetical protein
VLSEVIETKVQVPTMSSPAIACETAGSKTANAIACAKQRTNAIFSSIA